MTGQFTLIKSEDNQFIFQLKDDQESVLFTSNPFATLPEVRSAIEALKDRATSFPNFERKKTPTNKMYFIVKTTDGRVIGSSEKHASIPALENNITDVNKCARLAQIAEGIHAPSD
jgi:uncharacterized protein YegP (UPF0339 family)